MTQTAPTPLGSPGLPAGAPALIDRAKAIAPDLAGRASLTTKSRRLAPENVAQIKEASLQKVLLPKRCGGLEYDLHTHLHVVEELAAGCGSTGWCTGVWHAHSWLLGLFGEQTQNDFSSASSDAIISAVVAPRGEAKKVDNGYLLSGFWPFCSGVDHSDWLLLGERVVDEAGNTIAEGLLLLPTSDVEIMDDWNVWGLAGTGSSSVAVSDLFVPEHRFLSVPDAINGINPGAGLHETALYHSAFVPALALFLCGSALGTARRALTEFKKSLHGRVVAYTFNEKQKEMPVTHLEVAEAATKLDTARLLLHSVAAAIEEVAERRDVMAFEQRAKARMDCAYAVRLCLESVETLSLAVGGSGVSAGNPIQLAARDMEAVNLHGLLAMKTNLEMYGRVLLDLPPNSPLI